jgi:GT2 family glycosyltransferase
MQANGEPAAFAWLDAASARPGAVLSCGPNAHVAYDVMLPPDATVRAWCAVPSERVSGDVEFQIAVCTAAGEVSARCAIRLGDSWRGPRWRLLELRMPQSGPARIVLRTTSRPADVHDRVSVLWGNPCIESPRPAADLVSALRAAVSNGGVRGLWHRALPPNRDRLYGLWVREHEASSSTLRAQRERWRSATRLFTLITIAGDSGVAGCRQAAASLRRQSYERWESVIVSSGDPGPGSASALGALNNDPRVRMVAVAPDATHAERLNAALREAVGEFAALLGPDDTLSPDALSEMATALERTPDLDLLYTDEDRVDGRRHKRSDPCFKPEWSPDLLTASNFIGRLALFRVEKVRQIGAFRGQHAGAEEWDLWLRLSRASSRIGRLPRCLYHRGGRDRPEEPDAGGSAVRDHLAELGIPAEVTTHGRYCRASWPVSGHPLVSIVIPNRNAAEVLRQCLNGLLDGTDYNPRELVIVDNASTDPEVLGLYNTVARRQLGRVVPFQKPFNFSAACNAGAAAARGELLLFLNNDIEVLDPGWLEELVRWARRPEIGVVGAKLLYPDRTIQHAGVVFGLGLVGHIFSRGREETFTPFGSPESCRNYLAVTGACQMMRREVFEKLGGYDERFRLSFSDVVLCMRAWEAGYRVVYTPYARLVHHESHTRKREDSAEDMELLARYLRGSGFVEDPYFHPELDPKSPTPAVRPPFEPAPRQVIGSYVNRVLAAAATGVSSR